MDRELKENSVYGIQLRKSSSYLRTSGMAVLLFAFWDIIKTILYLVTDYFGIKATANTTPFPELFVFFMTAVIVIVFIFTVTFRLIIGITAVKEGKLCTRKKAYVFRLILGTLMVMTSFFSITSIISGWGEDGIIVSIASLIVEITSQYSLAELLINTVRLRILINKGE